MQRLMQTCAGSCHCAAVRFEIDSEGLPMRRTVGAALP
jgi:hypothetical protein